MSYSPALRRRDFICFLLASQLSRCQLAEAGLQRAGQKVRHLTSRQDVSMRGWGTSTPWLYERQNPSLGVSVWSSLLNKLLAQLNEVDSREPRLERASTSPLSPPRLALLPLASTFHRGLSIHPPLSLSKRTSFCVCAVSTRAHSRHGDGSSGGGGNSEGRSSVSRHGKQDPPSLSFITQVSSRPAIFLPPLFSFVTDLAVAGWLFFSSRGAKKTKQNKNGSDYYRQMPSLRHRSLGSCLGGGGGQRRTNAERSRPRARSLRRYQTSAAATP